MILSPGSKLGHYEVLEQIGAGGMGEVYRGHDPRLNRDVAIKVSNDRFSERFEREARAVAALNHPNICTLYDVGPNYLVMEFIEGDSPQGPMPLDTALGYALQIADALEAAHDKGIVHRDLKPGNIKIKPDGTIKVLDFGLAKVASATGGGQSENSPTISMAATQAGVILGTAAYMSPEQARGKPVDKRADIWSFGVVLYEMITGKRMFQGEDLTETLASVVMKEPDLEAAPAKVRRLLKRCLEKDPKKRLRDISGVSLLLEDPTPPSRVRLGDAVKVAVGVLAVAVIVLGVLYWRAMRTVEKPLQPLVRLDVDLGADVSLGSQVGPEVIISPDGNRIAYVSQNRLFTRRLDQPKATELAGTEGAYAPFFKPDGQWIAFFGAGKLKKISVEGGSAITLCDATNARGGSWGENGTIIAALGSNGVALTQVPDSGGKPTLISELGPGQSTHRWPQILPGGKAVLFTSHNAANAFDGANIEVMSLTDHSNKKTLQRGGTYGRYLPTGHLVYANRGTLYAVPFDLERLEVHGTPSPLLEELGYSAQYGFAQFDFSQTGTMVYQSGGSGGGKFALQWLDAAGKTQPLLAKPGLYQTPSLSPDGKRLAMVVAEGATQDIWIYDWERDTPTSLTFGGGAYLYPMWTPDSRLVLFQTATGISWTRSDGGSKAQSLMESKNSLYPWSFTPDGKRLAYMEVAPGTGFDIWTVPLETDATGLKITGKPEPYLHESFDERHASFSPDGKWIAYSSNEQGNFQVYVRAFPDKGGRWPVSNSGGAYPVWSRDGRELFFRTEDNQIMVAGYTTKGDTFVADKPRVWTEKRIGNVGLFRNFDLASDGKRVAAMMPADAPGDQKAVNHVTFLENFFDEVRRRGGK